MTVQEKIQKYTAFWEKTNSAPLLGFSLGSYFVSKRFNAAHHLLAAHAPITPTMVNVEAFMRDYAEMATLWEQIEHDIVFTASPFPGIPWMEAMLGCEVSSTGSSFVAHAPEQHPDAVNLEQIIKREWFASYLEFTRMLQQLGENRFPVGQPILRGPTDIVGTILGQQQLVYALYDRPEKTVRLLHNAVDRFLEVLHAQKIHIEPFYGGYAMGFYDIWCPGDCIWFQDDVTALCSPKIYQRYIYETHQRLAASAEYTMMHVHPASFYIMDDLLNIPELRAIQINKDTGGPSVEEMLPVLQKVQQHKNLVLCGDFTEREALFLTSHLPPEGVYILIWSDDANVRPERYRACT